MNAEVAAKELVEKGWVYTRPDLMKRGGGKIRMLPTGEMMMEIGVNDEVLYTYRDTQPLMVTYENSHVLIEDNTGEINCYTYEEYELVSEFIKASKIDYDVIDNVDIGAIEKEIEGLREKIKKAQDQLENMLRMKKLIKFYSRKEGNGE